jgi:hypothetical protein
MPTETPIACSLNADELKHRVREISAVGGDALRDVQSMPRQTLLRFAAGEETRERLTAIIAAEARCCAFMNFNLRDEAGTIVMTISAPDGAELVLDDLVAAFSGEVQA